jgi:hypothetical protein
MQYFYNILKVFRFKITYIQDQNYVSITCNSLQFKEIYDKRAMLFCQGDCPRCEDALIDLVKGLYLRKGCLVQKYGKRPANEAGTSG